MPSSRELSTSVPIKLERAVWGSHSPMVAPLGFVPFKGVTFIRPRGEWNDTGVPPTNPPPQASFTHSCDELDCDFTDLSTNTGATFSILSNDVFNGTRPGNFGWLTWDGQNDLPSLADSLCGPNNPAMTFPVWIAESTGGANGRCISAESLTV